MFFFLFLVSMRVEPAYDGGQQARYKFNILLLLHVQVTKKHKAYFYFALHAFTLKLGRNKRNEKKRMTK